MDNTFKNPTIISVGPGMRGIERGLERAIDYLFPEHIDRGKESINVAAYVEIESFVIWNMVEQMEKSVLDETPVWVDVKTFPFSAFHGKVHGITAGYPCQPFSTAGQRKGEEDPRHIFPYLRDGLTATGSIWAFFENVTGHLSLGYDTVKRELSDIGYAVEEGIFSAEEVGAPHQRKRLFILAIRKDWLENASSLGYFSTEFKERIKRYCKGLPAEGANKLGDPPDKRFKIRGSSGFRKLPKEGRKRIHDRSKQPSFRELAHPNFNERCPGYRKVPIPPETLKRKAWPKDRHRCWPVIRNEGDDGKLGNSRQQGLQRRELNRSPYERNGTFESFGPTSESGKIPRWPARPGQPQYEWEEPRTQPRMGCTVNGYNFREDLLRMLGNGVVEDTAEKAFIHILQKHINNLMN